ncbi:MAG: 3-phosphoshikimate 1-carboxyvinyltransferase [Planctomycetota bacterium]
MQKEAGTLRQVRLPGCKSLSARALILAACSQGESLLGGLSRSQDTRTLLDALRALGVEATETAEVTRLVGWGGVPRVHGVRIDLGAAATSLRLLLPLLAAGETDVTVTGTARLFERPHAALYEFLARHGARVESLPTQGDRGGVRIRGSGLHGKVWEAPVRETSQILSGLLLTAGLCGGVRVRHQGPLPSSGYVDLTLEALRLFRDPLAVQTGHGEWRVAPGIPSAFTGTLPGDPSAATFFLTALVLRGGRVIFQPGWSPVHPEARLQRLFFDHGLLEADENGLRFCGRLPGRLLEIDLDPAPDAGPALAVLGAVLPAGMLLKRASRLRLKESDRVEGIGRLAALFGRRLEIRGEDLFLAPLPDGEPAFPRKAAVPVFDPRKDHRLAMAAGVAALVLQNLDILDRSCVGKSFPRFWEELEAWK